MAKVNRNTKGLSVPSRGSAYEHSESYDDSLLPEAVELERLKLLDPNIIEWIKQRTEKEQDARIDFNAKRISIVEDVSRRDYQIDVISLIFAFLIIISSMAFSTYLIMAGQNIVGTIFAGATIIIAVSAFLNFRRNVKDENKKLSKQ
jgi:uncharacterized membrane protein